MKSNGSNETLCFSLKKQIKRQEFRYITDLFNFNDECSLCEFESLSFICFQSLIYELFFPNDFFFK